MLELLKTHLYIILIPVVLLLVLWRILADNRKKQRQFEEMSQRRRQSDALTEALRNPLMKESDETRDRPMEIRWEEKATGGRQKRSKKDAEMMAELVELSTYSRRKYVFRMDDPIRIGNGKGNQMEIPREGVAARHCEIFLDGKKPCLRCVGNEKTVLKRGKISALVGSDGVYLNNGDHILIGTAEILFKSFKA